jgi:flagellar biosynthesis/type III secretory pathway chaperone
MNPDMQGSYIKLSDNLEEQIRIYRHLLEVVRKEKEILISANLDDLNENNKTKEAMLIKIKSLEIVRLRAASELATHLGLTPEQPRLLEMAVRMGDVSGDKLRNLHAVLDLLIKRIQEYNKQNESLVQSALNNITGAMKAIRDTLQDKPTYQKKGEVAQATASSGQLVSKEA